MLVAHRPPAVRWEFHEGGFSGFPNNERVDATVWVADRNYAAGATQLKKSTTKRLINLEHSSCGAWPQFGTITKR